MKEVYLQALFLFWGSEKPWKSTRENDRGTRYYFFITQVNMYSRSSSSSSSRKKEREGKSPYAMQSFNLWQTHPNSHCYHGMKQTITKSSLWRALKHFRFHCCCWFGCGNGCRKCRFSFFFGFWVFSSTFENVVWREVTM